MPIKVSDAQFMVNYEQHLSKEENEKLGNVMRSLIDSYISGRSMRSEISLVLSHSLFLVMNLGLLDYKNL